MDHQLHPAAFVEETLGHHGLLSWQRVQRSLAREHVSDGLLGSAFVQPAFIDQKLHCAIGVTRNRFPQAAHGFR